MSDDHKHVFDLLYSAPEGKLNQMIVYREEQVTLPCDQCDRTADASTDENMDDDELMGDYNMNTNCSLKKQFQKHSIRNILKLSPDAFKNFPKKALPIFASRAVRIRTIGDMGKWKFFHIAKAIVALADKEEEHHRAQYSAMNINHAVDKNYEKASLHEMASAPIEILQGISTRTSNLFAQFGIRSVKDLANYKYFIWAQAFLDLAEFETYDFSHR